MRSPRQVLFLNRCSLVYLRDRQTDGHAPTYWFTPQTPATVGTGWDDAGSTEVRVLQRMAGTQLFEQHLLPHRSVRGQGWVSSTQSLFTGTLNIKSNVYTRKALQWGLYQNLFSQILILKKHLITNERIPSQCMFGFDLKPTDIHYNSLDHQTVNLSPFASLLTVILYLLDTEPQDMN